MSVKQSGSLEILGKDGLVEETIALIIGKHQDGKAKKIGLEAEAPFFERDNLAPIQFEGPKSITAVFNLMAKKSTGWQPMDVENGKVTSLKSKIGDITLEPGGQIEFASAPKDDLLTLSQDIATYFKDMGEICDKLGIDIVPYGFHPHTTIDECPYIHERSRFKALKPVFDAEGGFSAWGQSSSVQITLDTPTQAQAFDAFKLGMVLQPLAAAMTANSPFAGGEVSGYQSTRRQKLLDLDSPLYRVPDNFYDDNFGLKEWAAHVLTVPMSFIVRGDQYIAVAPRPFIEMVGQPLPELAHLPEAEQYLTKTDLLDHLTGIKPEMLLKPNLLLEFRAADLGTSPREWMGLAAFWTGLYYDQTAFQQAQDYVSGWTKEERISLRQNAARDGLKTAIGGTTAQAAMKDLLAIARDGLSRIEPSAMHMLDTFSESVGLGLTPADKALAIHAQTGDIKQTLKKTMVFANKK